MSRTRLIRPGFFSDQRMARSSAWTRLVYIGLWTLCDDAGFFERKPVEIAVALFPYDSPRTRERRVETALDDLLEMDRVRWLECGDHGLIPTLPQHVTKAGNHAYTHRERHESVCRLTLFRSTSTHESVRVSDKSPSVLGSGSASGLESGRSGASEFQEKVPRALALGGAKP